jgi:NitT/TauT family transport system substrate-binding protein
LDRSIERKTLSRRRFSRLAAAGGLGLALAPGAVLARPPATPAADSATPIAGRKIVIADGFMPNVQFSPFYLAIDRGYYAEAGLDVSIQDGSAADLLQQVGSGSIDFIITGGDALTLGVAAGIPVTYVMAELQKYPVGVIALADGGMTLTAPADLKGKRVGVSGPNGSTYIGLLALLNAGGLTLDDVEVVTIGFTEVEALQQKQVDAAMTFITNEPVQLKSLGIDVQVLAVSDFVKMVSTGLVAGNDLIANEPEIVQAVVTATLRGLQETLADPDAAFEAALKRLPEIAGDADQERIQSDVLAATLTFAEAPAGHPLGWSDPDAWQTTADLLQQVELIDHEVDATTLFTNQFAEAAGIA